MTAFATSPPKRSYLALTISMMTFLILLINVSFKIVDVQGMLFSASSILCPMVAFVYLLVLKECNLVQQRHILNQSLLALYLFSVGIYLLVNLPAAEYMHDNPAYQIVFEDIPKKFFATTLAFAVSFYLPHALYYSKRYEVLNFPKKHLLFALYGGFSFFTLDFILLFSHPPLHHFTRIYIDSLMVSVAILLIIGISYLICIMFGKSINLKIARLKSPLPAYLSSPLYHYLISCSVIILLICLACEYRLISFSKGWIVGASAILCPLTMMASNLIHELYGYKANLCLAMILIVAELAFDLILMAIVALPAPEFFDLNPYYSFILPKRIPAGTLALFVTFAGNALLLENLKYSSFALNRCLRILIANIFATSLLCLVNYTLLYGGVYPHELIFNLAINSWIYKLGATIIGLPLVLWLYNLCQKPENLQMAYK